MAVGHVPSSFLASEWPVGTLRRRRPRRSQSRALEGLVVWTKLKGGLSGQSLWVGEHMVLARVRTINVRRSGEPLRDHLVAT